MRRRWPSLLAQQQRMPVERGSSQEGAAMPHCYSLSHSVCRCVGAVMQHIHLRLTHVCQDVTHRRVHCRRVLRRQAVEGWQLAQVKHGRHVL